jgi:hypothetical protein
MVHPLHHSYAAKYVEMCHHMVNMNVPLLVVVVVVVVVVAAGGH